MRLVETLVEPLVEEPTADGTGLAPLGLGDGSVGENDLATWRRQLELP